ncbi:YbaY family lipoprotein [Cupriavidus necator]|uniref:YbaY family lipoprotein n=1 Tax=Cupriavidus necator TaxID=106590 RepID=UPI0039C04B3A
MNGQRTLTGRVRLREAIGKTGATLRVLLEDVSRTDAAATLVAEAAFPIARPLDAGTELPFSLTVAQIDGRARYNVRVHVDMTGSGEITAGDRISTVAHPVLTQGNPDDVTIEAREI